MDHGFVMDMDRIACYRAISTRDARFDGRLFVGVKTTGVYCRPICPARTPKFVNVSFYPAAAAAQEAGFRPCLRCRPEVSPELAFWRGTSNTVSRALTLIESGGLDGDDVEGLANRLGVGARQLRRLFAQHVGASPVTAPVTITASPRMNSTACAVSPMPTSAVMACDECFFFTSAHTCTCSAPIRRR